MKTIIKNLTGSLLITAAAIGTARPQCASQDLCLSDIKAQWPEETISASDLCQRAGEDPYTWINLTYKFDPKTLVRDLHTLMEKSDEVILAAPTANPFAVPSNSGKTVATYHQVIVIRSWKGSHHAGDTLVFGLPFGTLYCHEPPSIFSVSPDDWGIDPRFQGASVGYKDQLDPRGLEFRFAYLLFLRQSNGGETRLVQGLRLAAGEGMQGFFLIPVPLPVPPRTDAEDYCLGLGAVVNVQHCDAIIQTSQSPVLVPYTALWVYTDGHGPVLVPRTQDPFFKKYHGMPASDFLREVQSVADGQGGVDKSSLR